MSFSGARDFTIQDSSFTDVHRDYNHRETHHNGQSIYTFGYGVTPNVTGLEQHRLTDRNDQEVPIGSYNATVTGSQINHTYNIYGSQPGSPLPLSPTIATGVQPQQQDISSILDDAVKKRGQPLNWRESIVDMMKLLNLDSSTAARQKFAGTLKYQDDGTGSYGMNVYLLKYVKGVIARSGGNLSAAREIVLRNMS